MIESALTWIVDQVEHFGYLGIFVMMFLESTFFPFPSEVAMIPAGFLAAQDRMDFTLAVLAGILGSLGGAFLNYELARVVGIPVLRRFGKYILFDESKLARCTGIFLRHGEIATFVCRLVPVVRQYISLPAGISGMNRLRFGIYTGAGAGLWVFVLTAFGYWIGNAVNAVDTNPEWAHIKDAWKNHQGVIYAVTFGLVALLIVVYIAVHRRKPGETVRDVDTVSATGSSDETSASRENGESTSATNDNERSVG